MTITELIEELEFARSNMGDVDVRVPVSICGNIYLGKAVGVTVDADKNGKVASISYVTNPITQTKQYSVSG